MATNKLARRLVDSSAASSAETPSRDEEVERPSFISQDVWRVVQLAAGQNDVTVRDYVENALLNEAIILDQIRRGRRWLVEDKGGQLGEVELG